MRAFIYPILAAIILLGGCKAAEKQLRSGDFDQAIATSVKKLRNNPDKEMYILVLEAAFEKANARDLAYIESLHLEGQPDRWERIHDTYQAIGRRQNSIAPLLPLHIESEYRDAEFAFVDVVAELIESKKNAAAFLYANALQKLNTGNRYDARDAYYELSRIKELYSNYKDTDRYMAEALAAGKAYVSFGVDNRSNVTISRALSDALADVEPVVTSGMWYQFTSQPPFDLSVTLMINKLFTTPELVNTNNYIETAEVEDGWEYVYDEDGHVVKDSLGNPIKVTKYETVQAFITESWQEKTASVEGELRYTTASGQVLATIPVRGDGLFRNYFASATGYYDAISPETRQKLGGGPLPFPPDDELLIMAVEILEQQVQSAMKDHNQDVLNE